MAAVIQAEPAASGRGDGARRRSCTDTAAARHGRRPAATAGRCGLPASCFLLLLLSFFLCKLTRRAPAGGGRDACARSATGCPAGQGVRGARRGRGCWQPERAAPPVTQRHDGLLDCASWSCCGCALLLGPMMHGRARVGIVLVFFLFLSLLFPLRFSFLFVSLFLSLLSDRLVFVAWQVDRQTRPAHCIPCGPGSAAPCCAR